MLIYIFAIIAVLSGVGGWYLSSELKKYTDIGTSEEFKQLKDRQQTTNQ